MTTEEALAHLQRAVDMGKPGCFVQVSPAALALVLELILKP